MSFRNNSGLVHRKKKTVNPESGQGLTEYAVLLVLVSLAAVGITQSFGKSVIGAIKKSKDRVKTQLVFGD